ncbi:hypothetical protein C0Z17_28760 [Trinickia caryophylli]|nr:hypothetical protein C0Z17_28760 [Trinickia caryophylli]
MSEREAKEVARKLQRMADEARSADQVSQESERRRKAADKNGANTKYWHLAEALVPSMVEFGRKHGVPRDEVISIVHAKYKVWERDVKNTINIENEISSVAQQCKKIQRDQQGRRANEGATNSDGNKGTSDMPPVPSGAAGDRPNSGRATTVSPPGPQGSGAGNGGDDPEKPGGDPYAKKKPSDGVPSPKAPPAPPPPPPPGRLGGGARPGGWSKPEDALAIKAHQGPAYPYYSSFTIALEKLGIADYHDIKDEETFLSVWREVGQNMRAKNIDEDRIKEIVTSFDAMANEWSSYKKSDATEVFRGDTLNVRGSYGWLNDFIEATEKDAGAMSIDLDLEVKCSTMMSTSSDPEMGYVKPKTVMWHFKLPEGHQGVCEGIYGEAETTFPLYNRMHIDALHRLPAGQAYLGDAKRFGTQHRYVIEATMLPPLPR